ncbi:MAG: hypothetical protein INH34_04420 [Phycisphaerales bacterium]|nr:hypothetical protein [Phycisphaerales bacterium]
MTPADRQGDERFADWVDGRMSERERERFVAELRVNAQLREDLAAYERTVAAVRAALQAPTRPVAMADRVRAALTAAPAAPTPTATDTPTLRLLPRVLWSLGTAAAALLAALWLDAWSGSDRAPVVERSPSVARGEELQASGGLPTGDAAAGAAPGAVAARRGEPAKGEAQGNTGLPAASARPGVPAPGDAVAAGPAAPPPAAQRQDLQQAEAQQQAQQQASEPQDVQSGHAQLGAPADAAPNPQPAPAERSAAAAAPSPPPAGTVAAPGQVAASPSDRALADAEPAARAAAKAAPAPTPLLVLDLAAPLPGGTADADAAKRKPATPDRVLGGGAGRPVRGGAGAGAGGGVGERRSTEAGPDRERSSSADAGGAAQPATGATAPFDAAGLRAALRAFLTTAVAEPDAATASWATAAGVLQLSPWLDDPANAADGSVRSWLVEGDKADVAALVAVAAEFARDRAGAVQNGEVPVALPAPPTTGNRVLPSARLVLRLQLRRR